MSRWTHVAGMVRVDSIGFLRPERPQWHDVLPDRLRAGRPEGSEGPILYTVQKDPMWGIDSAISQGYIIIWGDLRDFGGREDTQKIIDWLNAHLAGNKNEGWFPRMGIIQIADESDEGSVTAVFEQVDGSTKGRWISTVPIAVEA